jgi:hypothetical protein
VGETTRRRSGRRSRPGWVERLRLYDQIARRCPGRGMYSVRSATDGVRLPPYSRSDSPPTSCCGKGQHYAVPS